MSNNYSNEIKAYIENNMVMPNQTNEIMPNSAREQVSNLKSEIEDYEPTQLEIANGFTKENIQNFFTAVIRNDQDAPAPHIQQEETKNNEMLLKEEYEKIANEILLQEELEMQNRDILGDFSRRELEASIPETEYKLIEPEPDYLFKEEYDEYQEEFIDGGSEIKITKKKEKSKLEKLWAEFLALSEEEQKEFYERMIDIKNYALIKKFINRFYSFSESQKKSVLELLKL